MPPLAPTPSLEYTALPRSTPDHASLWLASILASPEPAVLSRVLQKLICQQATIRTLRYELRDGDSLVEIEVRFAADITRAELLRKQWQNLVAVEAVTVSAA